MSVLRFKPYHLAAYTISEGHTLSNGDYVKGEEKLGEWLECDAVPSGEAAERTFEDGTRSSYSYTVYLRADCPAFKVGDKVRLRRDTEQDYMVKGFHRYQHQAKLWL